MDGRTFDSSFFPLNSRSGQFTDLYKNARRLYASSGRFFYKVRAAMSDKAPFYPLSVSPL
jgi:hypothetical protein